ncbi:MAG: iron-containing alcohol dehydrogenase, partial [Clostridia bacterium]|nr:iron-containing alcohol dehydrogenase [Clostridia bacterium]
QHIYQGVGSITKLPEIIRREKWKRVMLVCGPTMYKSAAAKSIEEGIRQAGAEVTVFTNIRPNPEAATIEREAIPAAVSFRADAIVAVGGGSTLDTAKGMVIVGNSGKRVLDFTIDKIASTEKLDHETLPMVAIPTTAGTGSEVCVNAVISDEAGIKLVLAHDSILPKYALLDPDLLKTLPFSVAAATASDTFVQALETLTNRNAHDFTRTQSLRSLELVGKSIRQFVANPADPEAANDMSLACMYAGFSLGLAGIGQDHIITHPMSESPFYMAHGDACAMVLPAVIEYNGLSCKDLYHQAYNALTGKHVPYHEFEVRHLIDWVVELNADLHIAEDKSFAEWGFNEDTLELMINHPIIQLAVRLNSQADNTEYPRMTGLEDYCAIIKRVAVYSELQAARARSRLSQV